DKLQLKAQHESEIASLNVEHESGLVELRTQYEAELERATREANLTQHEVASLRQRNADLTQDIDTERTIRLRKEGELIAVERQFEGARLVELGLREDIADHIKLAAQLGSDLETAKAVAAQVPERERQLEVERSRHEDADEMLAALPAQLEKQTSILARL